ncbi:hypothetical protein [Microbacterium suwonense]|uniref:Lipoprotein n=1 Tax=Microbacterium suwonense TaxID=683047 RepID=A0ABN6WZ20_9MICO|nr:hypothetical protein [Microbacterium suwonense]BDZ37750.1 hypothetical protein GCM10025863_03640 [Microbacterium suwonense]
MTSATASVRAIGALSAGLLALGTLAACTPEPKPTPTKTALFSSDEDAFKAAEETYRAYTDALNDVDTGDPKTFEPVMYWASGQASTALKKSLSELHAENVSLVGDTEIVTVTGIATDTNAGTVSLHICADVSNTDVIDSKGASLIPEGRAPVQSLLVDFNAADTSTGLRVISTTGDESRTCSQ